MEEDEGYPMAMVKVTEEEEPAAEEEVMPALLAMGSHYCRRGNITTWPSWRSTT